MFEKRNETLLHKEFVARRMRQAEQDYLARQLIPDHARFPRRLLANRTARLALSLIVLVLLLAAGGAAASAQEPIMIAPSSGPEISSAMYAFSQGFNAMHHGDYAGAITFFDDAINRRQEYAPAYAFRGAANYLLADYEPALADFDVALSLSPGYASAYNWRGMTYLALGDYEHALADSRMAIQLEPGYVEAYRTQSIAHFAQGQYVRGALTLAQYLTQGGLAA